MPCSLQHGIGTCEATFEGRDSLPDLFGGPTLTYADTLEDHDFDLAFTAAAEVASAAAPAASLPSLSPPAALPFWPVGVTPLPGVCPSTFGGRPGSSPADSAAFTASLIGFLAARGSPLLGPGGALRLPVISGRPLDVTTFYSSVVSMGGYAVVCSEQAGHSVPRKVTVGIRPAGCRPKMSSRMPRCAA